MLVAELPGQSVAKPDEEIQGPVRFLRPLRFVHGEEPAQTLRGEPEPGGVERRLCGQVAQRRLPRAGDSLSARFTQEGSSTGIIPGHLLPQWRVNGGGRADCNSDAALGDCVARSHPLCADRFRGLVSETELLFLQVSC